MNDKYEILPELYHLPCSQQKADCDRLINIEANKKIKEGYFADKLLLVVGLPKSASSVISSTLSDLIGTKRKYAGYMRANSDSGLRPELVKDFLNGGVLKYHPRPESKNLQVIELLRLKYVITLRHPLDQLTALLCHFGGEIAESSNSRFFYDHLFPIEKKYFINKTNDERLSFLISQGYLYAMLAWICEWLKFRDEESSMVIKYEDFFSNNAQWLAVFKALWGAERTYFEHNLHDASSKYRNLRGQENNFKKYPRGWTGKIGIWRDYYTSSNKAAYDHAIEQFIQNYPLASYLLEYYPELHNV